MSNIKIIGHDDLVGVYELAKVKDQLEGTVDGHLKYEIERGVEAAMRFSLISKQFRYLLGEVLTILEATVEDERRLNATKSLLKDKFHAKINWVYEQCGTPEEEQEYLTNEPDPVYGR